VYTKTLSIALMALMLLPSGAAATGSRADSSGPPEKTRKEYLDRHKSEIMRARRESGGKGEGDLVLLPLTPGGSPLSFSGSSPDAIVEQYRMDASLLDRYRRDAMFYPPTSVGLEPQVIDLVPLISRAKHAEDVRSRLHKVATDLEQVSADQSNTAVSANNSAEELRTVIADLRESLDKTRQLVLATQDATRALNESTASINADMSKVRQSVDSVGRRQTSSNTSITELQQAVKAISVVVDDQHTALARLQQQADGLADALEKSFALVSANNQAVLNNNEAVTALAGQLKALSADLAGITKRIEAIK
jgi:methyl-accepting chemotaxis protein